MRLTLLLSLSLACVASAQTRWTELGPAPVSAYTGRVAAIAASATNANLYYVGGADGGVWRTTDAGAKWTALSDTWPTTSIGALALDPGNDQILYAGTGEANFANHSRYGLGVFKSVDGGQTFTQHAESTFGGRCFARIRVHPTSTNVLYAAITIAGGFPSLAAARNHPGTNGPLGIFKSSDAGQSWTQLTSGIPTNVSATDVALDPASPQTIYAAFGHIFGHASNGVYKSIDGGASFTKLAGGLPATIGRITLAVAPSMSARVFASLVNPCDASGNNGSTLNVYRTDNGGTSWTAITPGSYQATYGWYFCTSLVGLTDANLFFAGGFSLARTTAGGGGWASVTPPHVDLHALEWDAAGRLLCGDDGGIHRSTNQGTSWTSINANLGLIQFYAGFSIDPLVSTKMIGGMQDNGSGLRNVGSWSQVLGGDGGCTAIDSTGTRYFAESQGTGLLYRSLNGGSYQSASSGISGRNCFLPAYEIHPANPMLMVYGTERAFQSTNGGTSWTAISPDLTAGGIAAIRGIAFAPSDANTIYASTNDGRIQVTTNGGGAWQLRMSGVLGWPRTTRPFAVHPTNAQRCWLAVGAFGVDQVRYTSNAGASWVALDGDLPDVPAHCVAVDPREGDPAITYVGTDQGVWRTVDQGLHWERYGAAMPNVPVIDLRIDLANNRLVAATQGRGAWQVSLARRNEKLGWPKGK